MEIQRAQRFSALLFFDGELVRKTAKAIVDEFGTLNAVTATSVQNIGEFAKLSGASVTDVVKLARLFDTLAISSEDAAQNLKDASFEAGILVDQAFNEIATQAEFFATFTDESAKNIQNALVFAKQLGTTLEATNRISEKLLDVESAITNQFKLSAILGRQINVEEAIRLNFLGQTDRAQEVVVSQIRQAVAELGGFNRLLPIQRRELATTFGLTVPELLKVVSADVGGTAIGAVGRTSVPLQVPPEQVLQVNQEPVVNAIRDMGDKVVTAVKDSSDNQVRSNKRMVR